MWLKMFIIIVLFSIWVDEYIFLFTFIDELLTIVLLVLSLLKIFKGSNKNSLTNIEKAASFLILIVIIFAVISTMLSHVQNTFFLQTYSLFAYLKFILIYLGIRLLLVIDEFKYKSFGKFIIKLSYIFSFIMVVLFFLDYIFDFQKNYSYRFGFDNIAYGFGHPAKFSTILILITSLNLYFNIRLKFKISYVYLVTNLFLLFTAGRVTAISFYLILCILLISFRYFRKYVFGGLLISGSIATAFIIEKFIHTFVNVEEARGILVSTGIEIAKRFFPYGSGLGTFGSNASRINYSELYYQYGLSNVWGLAPWNNEFLTDSYWAMIIGEFGFIAAVINLFAVLLLLLNVYYLNKGLISLVVSIPIFYLIISSPVDTIIISNSTLPIMVVGALLVNLEIYSNNYQEKIK